MAHIFDRIMCGVDDSAAGATAARIAARVSLPESSLELVSVEDPTAVAQAGMYATPPPIDTAGAARAALERGTEEAAAHPPVTTRQLKGPPVRCLENEIERIDATLVVVGTHDYSRPIGIALGSVATHMLHEAPCSVLIAREPRDASQWPRSIVVGVDGSPESAGANAVARQLAERLGATLRCVVAPDGGDLEAAREIAADVEELEGKPVDELTVLSEHADLVVVGSRGLKGLRALGSVSERVAHRAHSPVLVVRGG